MIAKPDPDAKVPPHPLCRFVTKEAVAQLLNVESDRIREIRLWPYVMHVVGAGISTFVSYADIPPILGAEPPTAKDFQKWRKRWKKNNHQAPEFWVKFYAEKFRQSQSGEELARWGQLVGIIKFAFSADMVLWLHQVYAKTQRERNRIFTPLPR